jgi:hypothetical protein
VIFGASGFKISKDTSFIHNDSRKLHNLIVELEKIQQMNHSHKKSSIILDQSRLRDLCVVFTVHSHNYCDIHACTTQTCSICRTCEIQQSLHKSCFSLNIIQEVLLRAVLKIVALILEDLSKELAMINARQAAI